VNEKPRLDEDGVAEDSYRVTLHDVAVRSGESANTVSRILRGIGKFNRPTMLRKAAKVHQIAADLNYRPNAAARALRRQAFQTVDLFKLKTNPGIAAPSKPVSRFTTGKFPARQALPQLEEKGLSRRRLDSSSFREAQNADLRLTDTVAICMDSFGHVYGDLTHMLLHRLHDLGLSAMPLNLVHSNGEAMLTRALASDVRFFVIHGMQYFPFHLLRRRCAGRKVLIGVLQWETEQETACRHRILLDHEQGGRLVARHLAAAGHRRVLLVGPGSAVSLAWQATNCPRHLRAQGSAFWGEWADLGGTIKTLAETGTDDHEATLFDEDALLAALKGPRGVTAVFGLRDVDAWAVQGILSRRRPDLLAELAIMGYGDTLWSRAGRPPFSSVNWNLGEVSAGVCDLIQDVREGADPSEAVVKIIKPRLVVRDSPA
jgi:DNA-binding LacI/PurR family transcriptional regulator